MAQLSVKFSCSHFGKVSHSGGADSQARVAAANNVIDYGSGFAISSNLCPKCFRFAPRSYDPGIGLCKLCGTYCDGDCIATRAANR